MNDEEILVDTPLVPDPDADEELGPGDSETIADEELRGSRFLLVRRAVEAIDIEGATGGAIKFACTFHASPGTRFVAARLALRLNEPPGVNVYDLAPREVRESEPVRFKVDDKGKLSLGGSVAKKI